ncbi:RNA-directed DNA polymerase, eukaryota [Tanacetum coccineum]
MFQKERIICVDNYVAIEGRWIENDLKIMLITVYAPLSLAGKIELWSSLSCLISDWDGQVIVMGDFNEARKARERYGTIFNERKVDMFNSFITDLNLIDVSLGGFRYTWTDKWAYKMSKLDRFLVTEGFYDAYPIITGIVLEKGIPDHRPNLFKESAVDYGATPFCFFILGWKIRGSMIWRLVIAQKAKIKWAIKEDENTSFFQDMLKKKRCQIAIKGVLRNGAWIEEPVRFPTPFLFSLDMEGLHDITCKAVNIDMFKGLATFFGEVVYPRAKGRGYARRGREAGRGIADNTQLRDLLPTIVTQIINNANNQGNGNGDDGEDNTNEENDEGEHETCRSDGGPPGNKGGAIAYTRWVKKMESVIDMSNYAINQRVKNVEDFKTLLRDEYCPHNEIQKLENESWNHIMVGAGHAAYTNRFHKLAKLVPRLVTPKFKRIDRNGLLKKSSEKRKESGETGRQENARSNNKRARTGKGFVAIDSGKKEFKGPHPKCDKCDYHHQETTPCRTCFNYNQPGHVAKGLSGKHEGSSANTTVQVAGNLSGETTLNRSEQWQNRAPGIKGPCLIKLLEEVVVKQKGYSVDISKIGSSDGMKATALCSTIRQLLGNQLTGVTSCLASEARGKGIDLIAACNRSLGDDMSISFWDDMWRVPRGGAESTQFKGLLALIQDVMLSDKRDSWKWTLGSNGFSVAYTRKYIDEHILHSRLTSTRWNRGVPIKVNVFMWRLSLNKLLTMGNLDRKGIDADSLLCPVCGDHVESIDHLFFSYGMARDLWVLLAKWCNLDIQFGSSIAEWLFMVRCLPSDKDD